MRRFSAQVSADEMIKFLSAFAILAVMATAVVAIPGVAPTVLASETVLFAKGDRLDIVSLEPCAQQTWLKLTPSCLHGAPNMAIGKARLVTTERR
jgi:hypothetical protein